MSFFKVGVVAALTNHHEVSIAFILGDFVAQFAVPLIGDDIDYTRILEVGVGIFKDGLTALLGDLCLGRFEFDELIE